MESNIPIYGNSYSYAAAMMSSLPCLTNVVFQSYKINNDGTLFLDRDRVRANDARLLSNAPYYNGVDAYSEITDSRIGNSSAIKLIYSLDSGVTIKTFETGDVAVSGLYNISGDTLQVGTDGAIFFQGHISEAILYYDDLFESLHFRFAEGGQQSLDVAIPQATICFTFDDTNRYIPSSSDTIISMFDDYEGFRPSFCLCMRDLLGAYESQFETAFYSGESDYLAVFMSEYGNLINFSYMDKFIAAYEAGCAILAHGVTHRVLNGVEPISSSIVRYELQGAKDLIEWYGITCSGFSCPNSKLNLAYIDICEEIFEYAHTKLNVDNRFDHIVPKHQTYRYSLEVFIGDPSHDLTVIFARIDECIAKGELLTLTMHEMPSYYTDDNGDPRVNEVDYRLVLDYVQNKVKQGLVRVGSCDSAYNFYYDLNLENVIDTYSYSYKNTAVLIHENASNELVSLKAHNQISGFEYGIEGTDSGYFDTGYKISRNTVIKSKWWLAPTVPTDKLSGLYGSWGGASNTRFGVYRNPDNTLTLYDANRIAYSLVPATNNYVEILQGEGYITVNGEYYDSGASSFLGTETIKNLFICAINWSSSIIRQNVSDILLEFDIYEGGNLIKSYRPIKNGLYESVVGETIQPSLPLTNVYIPTIQGNTSIDIFNRNAITGNSTVLKNCETIVDFTNEGSNTSIPIDLSSFNIGDTPVSIGSKFFFRNRYDSEGVFIGIDNIVITDKNAPAQTLKCLEKTQKFCGIFPNYALADSAGNLLQDSEGNYMITKDWYTL